MTARRARRIGIGALTILIAPFAAAAPPVDQDVARAVAAYDALVEDLDGPTQDDRQGAADRALAPLDIANLDAAQMRALVASEASFYTSRWAEVDGRLEAIAAEPTADGATAAIERLDFTAQHDADGQRAMIEAMLSHPALAEALQDGELWAHFMNFTWYVRPKTVQGLEPRLIALAPHIPERAPMLGVLGALDVFNIVAEADPERYERREPLRVGVVTALERLATYQDPDDPTLQRWNFARDIPGTIRHHIDRLEGPAVRGTLMNNPAPPVDFLWSSADSHLASLDDLKGRVVVLDFWATWCGPCIASFPRMRELVERYRGLPVEFVGVTSVQGTHYGPDGPIDCEGDPDKEFSFMEGFMAWKDMTWTVAFSKQDVFNPSYGIQGIPHVVILDAEGRVRAHKLHPHLDHDTIAAQVDALLREMGIQPPTTPPEEHQAP